jgi:hypothetical protein
MLVTPEGMVTLVSFVHDMNAEMPMLVTVDGIVTLVRLVQSWKSVFPMLVTPEGIVTLVKVVLEENTSEAMNATELPSSESGIVTAPPGPV